jgi:hypothetical protein
MCADMATDSPVRRSVVLRKQMNDAIEAEIAQRIAVHQNRIAQLRAAHKAMAAAARPLVEPLVLLAQGDSWFDYPLDGNSLTFSDTDIIAQLCGMGTTNPVIVNVAHHGDAATAEMSLPKQQRMIALLQDPANWLSQGKPDAILFSAGGNDIVGDQFCIWLDDAMSSTSGLNQQRFGEALGMVEACYQDLFEFRDRHAQGIPIFAHCYDFPIPNGVHPACVGPWLQPSLAFTNWGPADGLRICRQALLAFKAMLSRLESDPSNLFFLVDTQGVLLAEDWANELHPYPGGFRKLADRFITTLRGHAAFTGRV